jgi:hypothetical protein
MRVLISKYELKIISIKEHLFHDKVNLLLYTRKQTCATPKVYSLKLNICFYPTKRNISYNLQVLEVHTLSLYRLHQTES